MKFIALAAALAFAQSTEAVSSAKIIALTGVLPREAAVQSWRTDFEAALTEAKESHKPVLLDFTASWCGPCRMMEATTFADPAVLASLKNFVTARVDFDRNAELVGKYHVQAIPTLILLNQFGETVATNTGYIDAKHLLEWLASKTAEATVAVSKAEVAATKLRALEGDLGSNDSSQRERGISELLNAFLGKDEFSKAAEKRLEQLVSLHPAEMLPHLNDSHLAIRILLARQFALKLGEDFTYDPWDSKEARSASVTAWETKLSTPAAKAEAEAK